MPVAATNSETAMQQVLDNLGSLPNATGAAELDLIFLRGIMESPIVRSLAKAHERLEETKLEAVRDNNLELVQEILRDLAQLAEQSSTAAELARILQEPHFQSLLETHDSVASKTYETPPPSPGLDPTFSNQPVPPDAVRMVGIRKTAGEHLGVTFRVEGGELVIARILHGGMVAQQGLLHVGDIIKEVNGQPVGSDPRALQELLRSASGSVILKILPSYQEPHLPRQVFVKCHFDYDPARDSLIPCKEAGLRFSAGDLLQIVNQDDANWWQACHVEGGSAGLIPSQLLEEKRKAFVKRDLELTPTQVRSSPQTLIWDLASPAWSHSPTSLWPGTLCGSLSGKKKKRMMYLTTKNAEFDRHELLIYEEVARMPPFRRKTLVLIGAQGVGRRSLKNKLIMWDPDRYGTTVPYTSRRPKDSEREGQGYSFVSRAEMEADIRAGRYLEHGEYEGNLYGTRIDSIRGVVAAAGCVCWMSTPRYCLARSFPASSVGVSFCLPPSIFLYISKHSPISPQLLLGTQATSNSFSSLLEPPLLRLQPSASSSTIRSQGSCPRTPGPSFSSVPRYLSSPLSPQRYREYTPDPPLLQAVKVLRTAEFVPYVVFIEAPDFETLRAMNRAALESGVSTKQLTVRASEVRWEGCLRSGKGPPPNSWQPRAPHCSSASRTNDSY
uniref:Membrane palmitoylated protein 2 n=1 Tax=Sus scrofa TaxID=9823 RepID=A0A4X1TSR8_PIG